jgi:hypothetical protein
MPLFLSLSGFRFAISSSNSKIKEWHMVKLITILSILLLATISFAKQANEIPNFSDGSKIKCQAYHQIGNGRSGLTQKDMDVFYRIDPGGYEIAYFRKVETLGNYSYDGFCSKELCSLSIRDNRTNTLSTTMGSFMKSNQSTVQIQISSFGEDILATFVCQKTK